MKIAILNYHKIGGSGIVAYEIGRVMAEERGHEVHFVGLEPPFRLKTNQHEGLQFHRVWIHEYPVFNYPPYTLALVSQLAELIRLHDIEVIHSHYALPHAVAAVLARDVSKKNVTCVTTLHGTDITIVGAHPAMKTITCYAIEKSDVVTTVSHFLKKETEKIFHVCAGKIKCVYNFVNPRTFHPEIKPVEAPVKTGFPESGEKEGSLGSMDNGGSLGSRDKEGSLGSMDKEGSLGSMDNGGSLGSRDKEGSLGSRDKEGSLGSRDKEGSLGSRDKEGSLDNVEKKIIMHISNLRPVKRPLVVVRIFHKLLQKTKEQLELWIIGDGPLKSEMMLMAEELSILPNVKFLGVRHPVGPLIARADLMLIPSITESFGMAALEAMACGVPVVATRTGGLPEVIEDGISGMLFELEDIDGAVDKSLKVLTDKALNRMIKEQGLKVATEKFNYMKIIEEYEKLYRSV